MHRCNLTLLETRRYRDLPRFFADHGLELVCSLPCFRPETTDQQRGDGVHDKSIRALRRLNEVGYGDGRSGLRLDLVTNPPGAEPAGSQACMEQAWKREMMDRYGIRFDRLWCMTNMPIGRFFEWLETSGNLAPYLRRLADAFNPHAATRVMCRDTLSVAWDGRVYDCEFQQMLEVPIAPPAAAHIADFDLAAHEARPIRPGRHCFACTAGAGSSCGGGLSV